MTVVEPPTSRSGRFYEMSQKDFDKFCYKFLNVTNCNYSLNTLFCYIFHAILYLIKLGLFDVMYCTITIKYFT